jgi:hypothetical protein
MAIANDNIIMRGQRGRIGNIIFRRWGENTVASLVPDYRKIRWSKAQKANRSRFKDATEYAHKVYNDPEAYKHYLKKRRGTQSVWNVAISDFMLRPEIAEIDVHNYHGQAGNTIRVRAKDKYHVAGIVVMIINALGYEIESGMAVHMLSSGDWIYKALEQNPEWRGGRVVVSVSDYPRNVGRAVKLL